MCIVDTLLVINIAASAVDTLVVINIAYILRPNSSKKLLLHQLLWVVSLIIKAQKHHTINHTYFDWPNFTYKFIWPVI